MKISLHNFLSNEIPKIALFCPGVPAPPCTAHFCSCPALSRPILSHLASHKEKIVPLSTQKKFPICLCLLTTTVSKVLYHWLVQASLLIVKIQTDLDDQASNKILIKKKMLICEVFLISLKKISCGPRWHFVYFFGQGHP